MSDEAVKECEAQETAEREAKEREEAEKALAEQVVSETKTAEAEQPTAGETAIEIQAARFSYIENLERRIMADNFVEQGELDDATHCKTQVLLELVAVEGYASKLGPNDPSQKSIGVLREHLYKCYNKTEKMRERLVKERNKNLMGKHYEEFDYQTNRRPKNMAEAMPFWIQTNKSGFNIMHDQNSNIINLSGLGLSAGSMGMLSQLIKNPAESIKAQMPDLITEFASKVTGKEKQDVTNFITELTNGLNNLTSVKAMGEALEGVGTMVKMLSAIKGGNAI